MSRVLGAGSQDLHEENTPFDSQLLDDDDGSTLAVFCDLRQIDRHLGRRDADSHAIEDTAGNEHTTTIAGDLNRSPEEPPKAREHERISSSDPVRNRACDDGSHHGARSQSRSDSTLNYASRIVEVIAGDYIRLWSSS